MKTSKVRAINYEIVTGSNGQTIKRIMNIAEGTMEQVLRFIKNPKNDFRVFDREDIGLRYEILFEPVKE